MQWHQVYHAPFDVILSFLPPKQHYLEPDLIFVSQKRLSIITERNIQGAPDLVVEILSVHTPRQDWVDKRCAYESSGVPNHWVVDPEKRGLTAFRLDAGVAGGKYQVVGRYEGDTVFAPGGFDGLEISLGEIWGEEKD